MTGKNWGEIREYLEIREKKEYKNVGIKFALHILYFFLGPQINVTREKSPNIPSHNISYFMHL